MPPFVPSQGPNREALARRARDEKRVKIRILDESEISDDLREGFHDVGMQALCLYCVGPVSVYVTNAEIVEVVTHHADRCRQIRKGRLSSSAEGNCHRW